MIRPLFLLVLALCSICPSSLLAQKEVVDKSTDVLCFVPAATGFCVALAHDDRQGMKELGLSLASGIATNYLLEAVIRKDRPDGTGHHAFPSTHSVVAFDGATFLTRRYGWQWGVPAYFVSSYVAWGRCYADKHDVWDVIGGTAIGCGCALIFTHPFAKRHQLTLAPAAMDNGGCGLYFSMRW